MKRPEGIRYLTRCSDSEGRHWASGYTWPADECPVCHGTDDTSHCRSHSRYGSNTGECAQVAWRLAYITCRETGEPITELALDHAMGLVVNDHEDVTYMIRNYGHSHYR